jgi:hypothetical protein
MQQIEKHIRLTRSNLIRAARFLPLQEIDIGHIKGNLQSIALANSVILEDADGSQRILKDRYNQYERH